MKPRNRYRARRCARCLLAGILFSLVVTPTTQAQDPFEIPQAIAYQGYLTNTDGDAANGNAPVIFRLYDQITGGAALWQETQSNVVFVDGVFSVHLGSVESLADVSFDRPLWLGVSVAGSVELAPRVALVAVPYAFSVRGLRVEPGASQITPSPNLIGGYAGNQAAEGVSGATIGGGGTDQNENLVTVDFGTVGGGVNNQAGSLATVGGGSDNVAGARATVAGGSNNMATGQRSTVGGGIGNEAGEERSTVGGGGNNTAGGDRATVSGGENNTADRYATVGGGQVNNADGFSATIGGGTSNVASGEYATVSGGQGNEAIADFAAIGGGRDNRATALLAMVPGGFQNHATGFVSFAAGYNARAVHDGAFVWTDTEGIPVPFSSTGEDQFLIRAAGGVGIGTNTPQGALHTQAPDDDTPDLVLGGTESDDNGLITSDPTLPSSDINLFSNGGVGIKLDSNNDENNALFIITDGEEDPVFAVGETGRVGAAELDVSGTATADEFVAEDDLGDTDTPAAGGLYQDNVVYAWAHVQADGTVTASYGCTVSKLLGAGSYRVSFKRQLPNGASAVVTAQTLNDPVIATAVTNANQADVATKVFNGAAFVGADYGFYIQVVGRP